MDKLYKKVNIAMIVNDTRGDFFRASVRVRQGCLLSPTLFIIYLEKIMQNTLNKYTSTIEVGGYGICNLRFANDIDLISGSIPGL